MVTYFTSKVTPLGKGKLEGGGHSLHKEGHFLDGEGKLGGGNLLHIGGHSLGRRGS